MLVSLSPTWEISATTTVSSRRLFSTVGKVMGGIVDITAGGVLISPSHAFELVAGYLLIYLFIFNMKNRTKMN